MNKLFIFFLGFVISTASAQEASSWDFQDSIKGGELAIRMDKKLESILKGKEKSVCQKTTFVPPVKLSPADKCATQQKIMGYKIQIFYTKDRSAAEKVKNDFARQFPSLTPELIYASPDYRILVGDYFTRQTAGNDLRKVQRTYPAAFPVQWRVWCRKAL
ncbi:SPOR domain-containing protein [Moheibacter stercoris]|uniref:SPOR domain-containing protein n=1 Tax=Moheibacter stercoris TaxID=1628251 RepID=A0ABV2LWD1_9FLAO